MSVLAQKRLNFVRVGDKRATMVHINRTENSGYPELLIELWKYLLALPTYMSWLKVVDLISNIYIPWLCTEVNVACGPEGISPKMSLIYITLKPWSS